MVTYCADEQPEVRQAAAYGVGVMAQFGGAGFAPVLKRKRLLVPSSLMIVVCKPAKNQLLARSFLAFEH